MPTQKGAAAPTPAEKDRTLNSELEAAADAIFSGEQPPAGDQPPAEKTGEQPPAGDQPPAEKTGEQPPAGDQPPAEKTGEQPPAGEKTDTYEKPEGLTKRASERFDKLVTGLKEKDTAIAQYKEQIEKTGAELKIYTEALEAAGMDGAEAVQMIRLGSMMKHNPDKAVKVLHDLASGMARKFGIELPGVDVLDGHADLQQRVKDREITREDAVALAAARRVEQSAKEKADRDAALRRQQEEQGQQTKAQQEATNAALEGVKDFLLKSKSDPDYQKIVPYLVDAAKFARENLDPSKWVSYIQGEYKKIKTVAEKTSVTTRQQSPITDTSAGSGGGKVPQTLDELADKMF